MVTRNSQTGQIVEQLDDEIVWSTAGVERAVANGMLMVVVQPEKFSQLFTPGAAVVTIANAGMRLGPGTNYAQFSTIPSGSSGTILAQMNGLNGVLAKSTYWWYVNIGGVYGWLPQEVLSSTK
jgi:uncharacterized protein YraI